MIDLAFYDRPVLEVAPDLIGCVVRHGDTAGVIVETEAYHGSEPASHAWAGLTARTEPLFGPPGIAYVYRSYGIQDGHFARVLGFEPLDGIEVMRARRRVARDQELCNGPGKLTQALGIGLELNRTSLLDGPIRIEPRPPGWEAPVLDVGKRIGITKAVDLDWRFCARGNRHVSRPWPRRAHAA